MDICRLKMCVFVTSKGQKMIIFAICFVSFRETQNTVIFDTCKNTEIIAL